MSGSYLKIGILGGGIGGLALSISLKKFGHQVTVFEQSRTISTFGAGVQLSPNGLRVLNKLGVKAQTNLFAYSPERIVLINGQNNRQISEIKLAGSAFKRYQANFLQIHRSDLIKILYDTAVDLGVEFNFGNVAVIGSTDENTSIICVDKRNFEFDVAIGADGVHSSTRESFFKGSKPSFLGQVAYRTTIPLEKVGRNFCIPEVKIFLGPRQHIVLYPLLSRSLLNIVFCQDVSQWSSDGWSVPADISEVVQNFKNFKGIDKLLNEISSVHKWGLFGYSNPIRWNLGTVALLGDACHPMLPYLAQGANQALEDALSLGYFLSPNLGIPIPKALEEYSKNRRDRVVKVQKASLRNAKLYHLTRGPVRFTSHLGLKLISSVAPNFLLSQLDWLYSYNFPR